MLLPCTVLESRTAAEAELLQRGVLEASSMRRLRSSFFSSWPNLVVTRPSTTILPWGRKRSGRKSPERSSSYSMK